MPTRTRHGFTRCPDCRRHVHAPGVPAEFVCPFCSDRPRRGTRTRTAVLVGALALAGCGASEAESSEAPTEPVTETPSTQTPGESPSYEPADDPAMTEAYGAPPEEALDDTPEDEPLPDE